MIVTKQIAVVLLLVSLMSCQDKPAAPTSEAQSRSSESLSVTPENINLEFHNDDFIVFSQNYDFLGVFRFSGETDYAGYSDKTSLAKPLGDDYFIEVRGTILARGAGTSPDPHGIYFTDLSTGMDLIGNSFSYVVSGWQQNSDRHMILKEIGRELTADQKARLDEAQFLAESAREQEHPDNFGGLMYYEEYEFGYKTRELTDLGIVYTRLLQ